MHGIVEIVAMNLGDPHLPGLHSDLQRVRCRSKWAREIPPDLLDRIRNGEAITLTLEAISKSRAGNPG